MIPIANRLFVEVPTGLRVSARIQRFVCVYLLMRVISYVRLRYLFLSGTCVRVYSVLNRGLFFLSKSHNEPSPPSWFGAALLPHSSADIHLHTSYFVVNLPPRRSQCLSNFLLRQRSNGLRAPPPEPTNRFSLSVLVNREISCNLTEKKKFSCGS